MKKPVRYLVRKLAIIKNDGQFQKYGLCYLLGESLELPEDGSCLKDISISCFDREKSGVTYVDTMTLEELPNGIWKKV